MRLECAEVFLVNLGVGREDDHLVTGMLEEVHDKIATMLAVKPSKRCIDDERELPAGGERETPEERDRKDLFLPGREKIFWDRMTVRFKERDVILIIDQDIPDIVVLPDQAGETGKDIIAELVDLLLLKFL